MNHSSNSVNQLRPEWRRINKPNGVEYGKPYYMPSELRTNQVQYDTHRQWTNVRGYGNILVYSDGSQPFVATYNVSQWNV